MKTPCRIEYVRRSFDPLPSAAALVNPKLRQMRTEDSTSQSSRCTRRSGLRITFVPAKRLGLLEERYNSKGDEPYSCSSGADRGSVRATERRTQRPWLIIPYIVAKRLEIGSHEARARAAGKESVMQLSLQRTTSDRRASGRGAEFEKTNDLLVGGTRDPDGWAHVPGSRTEATFVSGAYFVEGVCMPLRKASCVRYCRANVLERRTIALHYWTQLISLLRLPLRPACPIICWSKLHYASKKEDG